MKSLSSWAPQTVKRDLLELMLLQGGNNVSRNKINFLYNVLYIETGELTKYVLI